MYCKHCGKEIDDDSAFCKYCGSTQLHSLEIIDYKCPYCGKELKYVGPEKYCCPNCHINFYSKKRLKNELFDKGAKSSVLWGLLFMLIAYFIKHGTLIDENNNIWDYCIILVIPICTILLGGLFYSLFKKDEYYYLKDDKFNNKK